MTTTKLISAATWASLPEINITADQDLTEIIGVNGDFRPVRSDVAVLTITDVEVTFDLSSTDGGITARVNDGEFTLTFTDELYSDYTPPGGSAGVIELDTADIVDGLLPAIPVIGLDATASLGDDIDVQPGLTLFDDDLPDPVVSYEVYRVGVAEPIATTLPYTVVAADEGQSLVVREVVTPATGTPIFTETASVSVAAAVADLVTFIPASNQITDSRPTTGTVDLSSFALGDVLSVIYGGDNIPVDMSVNGGAAITPLKDFDAFSDRRGGFWQYTPTQSDINAGSASLAFTDTSGGATDIVAGIMSFKAPAGITPTVDVSRNITSRDVTFANASNTAMVFANGVKSVFDPTPWAFTDALTSQQFNQVDDGTFTQTRGQALGTIQNAPVGTHTVTATPGGTGNYLFVIVKWEATT